MQEVPVVFGAPKNLRALNVAAVGASVAACTAAAFMYLLSPHGWTWAFIVGLPTAFCAALWAVCLRWRKTTKTGVRYGWLLSVPLAALCSAMSGGVFFAFDMAAFERGPGIGSFVGGALLGGTFGVVIWLPALLLVLAAFGLPIARAQRMARLGVAGEERGEILVGVVSALLGAVSLAIAYAAPRHAFEWTPYPWSSMTAVGHVLMHVLSLLAVGAGTAAALIARTREARRQRFVARVEASEVPGFRVEKSAAGKVLLRVAPVAHYRVADVAEELFELDESGSVTRPLQGASRSQSA